MLIGGFIFQNDLHLDLDQSLLPVILEKLKPLEYDLAVITGDYRESTSGRPADAIQLTAEVVKHIKTPVYGVLGNHDFIEMVPALDKAGLRMLLNETVAIEKNQAFFYLSGIDDPSFYQTHDLSATTRDIPPQTCTILLSHSPNTYAQAATTGYDLMLCGHTHGGQICLPGGIPIVRNGQCPAHMLAGSWAYENMAGYTSRGTGACGAAVRFFCPPEITVHVLCRW